MKSQGQVLVQVLIMGVLLLVLVTVVVKSVTHHYQAQALTAGDISSSQGAQASISSVQSAWNSNGQTCSSFTWSAGNTVCCNGACDNALQGTCACTTCNVTIGGTAMSPVIVTGAAPNCTLTVNTTYP